MKLSDLSLNQILSAEFEISPQSPVIRPFHFSFVAADPSLLTPGEACDGLWHIFFHTTFGVWQFVSDDGIDFKPRGKLLSRAMRPDINFTGGRYLLFYESTRPLLMNALNIIGLARWKSEIRVIESRDLVSWSRPKPVITHTRGYEKSKAGISISNPFYFEENGKSRLYYSCGLTYIKDCGFCEPTYISYAGSDSADGGYVSAPEPIISPDPHGRYTNLCSGCLKVYRLSDGYIGIQNGIYSEGGKSKSAIMLLTSRDGLDFEFRKALITPSPEREWMAQYVYASHLVPCGDELRLYFNARDKSNPLTGRECIGFASAKIK